MHKFIKFCAGNLINCQNSLKNVIIPNNASSGLYLRQCSTTKFPTTPPPAKPVTTSDSSTMTSTTTQTKKLNFNEMITNRRNQAQKSILVQVNSEKSYSELWAYCSQFGDIISAHHYAQDEYNYILLEFNTNEEANAAINQSSCYNEDSTVGIVVQSQFLWFRAGPKPKLTKNHHQQQQLNVINGNQQLNDADLFNELYHTASIDEQMKLLHARTCLNDCGIRLRFIAARQIERAMIGMFPDVQVWPFGSSVNGFGKLGCDLDLILRLSLNDENCGGAGDDLANKKSFSRLVFHTKENLTNGRSQTQRQMETLSDMMQLFLPGICHVRRILQARVPIIKYRHEHLDLEVDLSMSNLTGVYMSELLYMFGQIDNRVVPLVFSIRRWAKSVGLTNPSPGRWISNFSLTCLVIFFLQQQQQSSTSTPILPSINLLIQQARQPTDIRITEDGINCTILRDLNLLNFQTNNKSNLEQLLMGFFEFYSQMDFNERAISLNEGRTVIKPDHSPMYIINPLEPYLNVTKNLSIEECDRFRIEVRNAAWSLDSYGELQSSSSRKSIEMANESSSESSSSSSSSFNNWGLLSLVKTSNRPTQIVRPNMFFKPRMVDVSELFDEKNEKSELQQSQRFRYNNNNNNNNNKTPLRRQQNQENDESTNSNSDDSESVELVEFKNKMVKKEVEEIQKKTRNDIQQLSSKQQPTITTLPSRARKR